MSFTGKVDRLLDRIPGYAGYRDKERRRDTDQAIRETLARDYGQLAERLGRLLTRYAEERKIGTIGTIDKPHKRLVSFIDRLRTASYGYAPIFSDNPVGNAALDQLAAFDQSLADQQPIILDQIDRIERLDPGSEELRDAAADLTATIEALHDRFDKRNDVIQTGNASTDTNVLALLERPAPSNPPVAYRLHEGDAVSYGPTNYSIVGRVSVESSGGNLRLFQLRGGDGSRWFGATDRHDAALYWFSRQETSVQTGAQTLTIGDRTYTLAESRQGSGEVTGQGGSERDVPVRVLRYASADSARVMMVLSWGSTQLVLAGEEIAQRDIELFTKEQ